MTNTRTLAGRRHATRCSPRVRAAVLAAATLLTAACSAAPTAPTAGAAATSRSATAAKLAPTSQSVAGKGGYMLSSGLTDTP